MRDTIRRALAAAVALLAALFLSACSGSSAAPAASSNVTSTLRTYRDYDEMTQALGFHMVQIQGAGYEPQSFSSINGQIGQIIYQNGDIELNMRMAPGKDSDISGVNGASYIIKDISGIEVHIGAYKTIQSAWFIIGDNDYGMSATSISSTDFEAFVAEFIRSLTQS